MDNKTEEQPKEVVAEKQPEPKLVEFSGKQFDISTPEGVRDLQTWSEAMSVALGRQGQELGSLRKFKQTMAPTESMDKTLSEVQRLREEEKHLEADKLLLAFTKRSQEEARKSLEAERENERTWRAYLDQRKDLVSVFGEDKIRAFSESNLDLNTEDPFKILDAYWQPELDRAKKFLSGTPVETPDTVIPAVSGGRAPVKAQKEEAPAPVPSVDEILNEFDPFKVK